MGLDQLVNETVEQVCWVWTYKKPRQKRILCLTIAFLDFSDRKRSDCRLDYKFWVLCGVANDRLVGERLDQWCCVETRKVILDDKTDALKFFAISLRGVV